MKDFFIPVEVMMNKRLSGTCILLFPLIQDLDHFSNHCSATNAYFATYLNVSKTTISNSITTLIKQKYIQLVPSNSKKRIIQINPDYPKIHEKIRIRLEEALS